VDSGEQTVGLGFGGRRWCRPCQRDDADGHPLCQTSCHPLIKNG
jgi:hypothetical protein